MIDGGCGGEEAAKTFKICLKLLKCTYIIYVNLLVLEMIAQSLRIFVKKKKSLPKRDLFNHFEANISINLIKPRRS